MVIASLWLQGDDLAKKAKAMKAKTLVGLIEIFFTTWHDLDEIKLIHVWELVLMSPI